MAQMLFAKLVAMLIPVRLLELSCETVFKNGCAKLFMKRFSKTLVHLLGPKVRA
jgi:hypothetical protein